MKKPLSLIAGLLVMWGFAMVAVPETAAQHPIPGFSDNTVHN